jgi:molecular chaperone IbpA
MAVMPAFNQPTPAAAHRIINNGHLVEHLTLRGIGFANQFNFFEELFKANTAPSKYPPYDILSTAEDAYEIRFALAGFKKVDVDITFQNNILTVSGGTEDEDTEAYFHKGIAARKFTHSFPLAEYVEVVSAEMADGILTVALKRELPEGMKSRTIKIK